LAIKLHDDLADGVVAEADDAIADHDERSDAANDFVLDVAESS
jgi:hypothetical protein